MKKNLIKHLTITILLSVFFNGLYAQDLLAIDTTLSIPPISFDGSGELAIVPSVTSSASDFDFLEGIWKLRNKRLKCRLAGCTEWSSIYETKVVMTKILNGIGSIDNFYDKAEGKNYEGLAVRLFNPRTKLWSIYWADSNIGSFDPPVVGSFENNVGHFFSKDTYQGISIIVVFRWDVRNPLSPIWSQAFSQDNGETWEWNMINVSEKVK